jgi:hypothetical protein
MDIDQHPFVRMARGGTVRTNGTTAVAPPTIHSPGKRRALYLELFRLLHAMQVNEAPVDQSWQALLMRVERAESLWQQLVALVETPIMNDEDDNDANDEREATQRQMDALENQLQRVTRRARECVLERRQQDTSVNHMERIFLAPLVAAAAQRKAEAGNDYNDDDPVDEEETIVEDSNAPFRTPGVSKTATSTGLPAAAQPNVQDLQKAQREQIEEAISQMASQMKTETARIHATLQNQAVGLDKMEDLTSENVVKVTQVATDVQQHVSANWTRAIGTWTLLFTVLGTFLFCLVTISMIPKRPGACLFNCPKADEQFCRILPGGRKECINVAAMEQQQQQQRRDEEEETTEWIDLDLGVNAKEKPEQTCEVGMNGECLNLKEDPVFQTVDSDQDVDAKEAPEQTCEVGMNGECLNLKEDPVFQREAEPRPTIDIPEIRDKDMFEETFEAFEDTQTAEVKEPVKPDRAARATGGGGGLFSQENVADVDPDTVPLYKGKPFSPKNVREAAAKGDTVRLAGYLRKKPEWVNKQDKNMWASLHLAVRAGSLDAVKVLLDAGCDDQLETVDGRTALDMAIEMFGRDHPIVKVLEK